jgi:hypothetical protein
LEIVTSFAASVVFGALSPTLIVKFTVIVARVSTA